MKILTWFAPLVKEVSLKARITMNHKIVCFMTKNNNNFLINSVHEKE